MQFAQYKTVKHQKVKLFKEFHLKIDKNITLLSPDKIFDLMTKHPKIQIQNNTCEYLYMLCMNKKGHPTALFELSKGTVDRHIASPRDAILNAVLANSVNVALIHNHPSGNTEPSTGDKELTKAFVKAFDICDINLIDHIIIGDDTFTSLRMLEPNIWT